MDITTKKNKTPPADFPLGYSSLPQKKSLHRPPTPHFSLSFLPQHCAGLHFNAVDKPLPVKAITHTEGETGGEGEVGGTEEPEIMPWGCVYVKRENSARININRASQGMGGFQQNLNWHTHP